MECKTPEHWSHLVVSRNDLTSPANPLCPHRAAARYSGKRAAADLRRKSKLAQAAFTRRRIKIATSSAIGATLQVARRAQLHLRMYQPHTLVCMHTILVSGMNPYSCAWEADTWRYIFSSRAKLRSKTFLPTWSNNTSAVCTPLSSVRLSTRPRPNKRWMTRSPTCNC